MTNYTHNSLKPGTPVLGALSQSSPSYTPHTQISGTYAFSNDFMQRVSISFYSDINCLNEISNSPSGSFAAPGIGVDVPANLTTPIMAASFNELGNRSDCVLLVNFKTYDTAPINLNVATNVNGTLSITWAADNVANPAPNYTLKRSLVSGGPYTAVYTGTAASYIDREVTNGSTYYYVVQASNSSGMTLDSAQASGVATASAPIPGASLAATSGAETVSLSWTGFNQDMGYLILRSLQAGGPYTELPARPAATTYDDVNLTDGTTYYYVVKGYNSAGKSITSNEVRAIPLALASQPNTIWAVPNLTNPACGGNPGVSVFWLPPPYYKGFRVYRDVIANNGIGNIVSTVTGPTYVDCSPFNGFINRYAVRTTWGSATSNASPVVDFIAGATTMTLNAGNGNIIVNWSAPTGTTTIELFRSLKAEGPFDLYQTLSDTGTYTDTGVTNGIGYYYYIQARDGIRVMGWPSPRNGAVPGIEADPPTNLSLIVKADNSAELTWTAPTNYSQFIIQRGLSSSGPFTQISSTALATATDVTAPDGVNYYQVRTVSGTYTSAPSNIVSFRRSLLLGLNATSLSNSIDLTWTATSGMQDYRVERATSSQGPFVSIAFPTTNSYSDTGATVDQGYYYRVTARFSDGTEGQKSDIVSGTRTGATAPTGLTILGTTSGSVNLGWLPISNAARYKLYSATSLSGPYTLVSTTPNNSTFSYLFLNLSARTQYYFKVGAIISSVEYMSAAIAGITFPALAAPTGTAGNNVVDLTWASATGAINYSLERSVDSVNFAPLASGIGTPAYSDSSAIDGQKYFYRLTAHYTLGDVVSPESLPFSPGRTSVPPAGLTIVSNTTGTFVTLSWTPSAGANAYRIYKSTSPSGPFTFSMETPSNSNVSMTGLTPATRYYFQVTSITGALESAPSAVVGTLTSLSTPAPIVQYSAPNTFDLTWAAVTDAVSYDIYCSNDGFNFTVLVQGLTGTTYSDNTATQNLNYYYYYQPIPADSVQMARSLTSIVVAPQPIPIKPQAFTVSSTDSLTVKMDWENIPQVTSYQIYRSTTSGSGYTLVNSVNSPTVTFIDNTVVAGTTYYYILRALNASGVPSPDSDEQSIVIASAPTGLAAVNNAAVISVTWNAVALATQYKVWRSNTSGGPYGLIATTASPNYDDNTGEPNVTYYYSVSSVFSGPIYSALASEVSVVKNGSMSLQHAIELFDRGVASRAGVTYTFERTRTNFNTNNYDGSSVTYQLELVASNVDGSDRNVTLVNAAGTTLVSVPVTAGTTNPNRIITALTPDVGIQQWRLKLDSSSSANDLQVYSARVLVTQVNATKTKLYFPLLSSIDAPSSLDLEAFVASTHDTNFSVSTSNMPYRRQAAQLSNLLMFNAWSVEAIVARTTGTAEGDFALQNSTTSNLVDKTTTEFKTTVPTLATAQINEGASQFATANEDNIYNIQLRCRKNCDTGDVALYKAGLWVQLENMTKAQIILRTSLGMPSTSTDVFWDEQRTLVDLTKFSNPVVRWQATATSVNGTDLSLVTLGSTDSGVAGPSQISGSVLSFPAASDFVTLRTSPVTVTSGDRHIASVQTNSPTRVHGSALVIDVGF